MARLVRQRLRHHKLLLRIIKEPAQLERHRWRYDKTQRRLRDWENRVVRLRRRLREVSDEYPRAYLRVLQVAAYHGDPVPRGRFTQAGQGPVSRRDDSRGERGDPAA